MNEHEETLLYLMLSDNTIIASLTVSDKHFSSESGQNAFKEICHQYDKHGAVDLTCLMSTGLSDVERASIAMRTAVAATFRFHEGKVKDQYKSNMMHTIVMTAYDMVNGTLEGDPLAFLEKEITAFQGDNTPYKTQTIKDVLLAGINEVEKRYNLKGELPGISSGLIDLDNCLHGFQDRQYYIVGARPSDGKTAIGLCFMITALKLNKRVGFISAESSTKELSMRMMANTARVDASKIVTGTINKPEFSRLMDSNEKLSEKELYFYDEPSPMIEMVERKAREWKRRHDINILFIDYVQFLAGGVGNNNHEKKADISKRIKALARNLDIPIVAMAQLKNSSAGKAPTIADIAETDQIARDADGIVLISHQRDAESNQLLSSRLIIDKARDGKQGVAHVKFEGEFLKFRSV